MSKLLWIFSYITILSNECQLFSLRKLHEVHSAWKKLLHAKKKDEFDCIWISFCTLSHHRDNFRHCFCVGNHQSDSLNFFDSIEVRNISWKFFVFWRFIKQGLKKKVHVDKIDLNCVTNLDTTILNERVSLYDEIERKMRSEWITLIRKHSAMWREIFYYVTCVILSQKDVLTLELTKLGCCLHQIQYSNEKFFAYPHDHDHDRWVKIAQDLHHSCATKENVSVKLPSRS